MKILKSNLLSVVGLAVVLLVGLSACGKKQNNPPPSAPLEVLPAVQEFSKNKTDVTNPPPKMQVATKAAVITTNAVPAVLPLAPQTRPVVAPAVAAKETAKNITAESRLVPVPPSSGSVNQIADEAKRGPNTNEMGVAFMALEQSKPNVAIGIFTKVLQKDPKDRKARFGLSTALIQAEKYKEAMAILEDMIKEVPQDYVTKNNLAWIYATATDLKVRDGKRAVELAQDALMINPTDCHVWSTLSEAYFICGRYDKALRNAEHALRVGRDTNADSKLLTEYQNQVERCRKAAESMAILE